ncbi:GTPase IMAP family member 9-like isoform X2 [Chanodichthys erythropterus]
MGGKNSGKTSVMNTILKNTQYARRTKECVMSEGKVDERKLILIDTPGWWPYASVKETSEPVKQEIMSSVTMCPPGPHAVLLVLQSGVAFIEAQRRSVKEHMELLGRDVWKYCIVVFSRGDWMGTPTIEEHIESEGEDLQWLINKCGNRYHVLNNMVQDDEKQVRELMEKVEMMARMNTVLPKAVGEALEKMEDSDDERACKWETEHVECRSFLQDRPKLDESFIEKWQKDLHIVSDYGTMTELSEIEQIEEEQRQKSKTPVAARHM